VRDEARVELAERFAHYVATGSTFTSGTTVAQPTSAYRDEAQWRRERLEVFGRAPVVVALSGQLTRPGDFATFDLPDLPTLTVRGADGRARVFVNACRHRGVMLTEEPCGHAATLVCPFHAWSYRTDGRLAAIPHAEGFEPVDAAELGLVELPSTERLGFVWVHPGDLDAFLGAALVDELSSYGLDRHHVFRSTTIEVESNWKLFYETFLEFYHGVYLHRSTLAHLMQRNLVHFDRLGEHWRMAAAKQSIQTVAATDPAGWNVLDHAVVSYDVFPNLAINVHGDHVAVYRVLPHHDRADRCRWTFALLTPEPVAPDSKAARYFGKNFDYIVSTGREDMAMAASAQRTLAATDRVLHGGFEPVLQWFHQRIGDAGRTP
jgi:phenylpropionate dioxygenase-like ring-hydroxylating dioxygenase large terminal subunit